MSQDRKFPATTRIIQLPCGINLKTVSFMGGDDKWVDLYLEDEDGVSLIDPVPIPEWALTNTIRMFEEAYRD